MSQQELERGAGTLKDRLLAGEGTVVVLGVGYVGLPLAVKLAKGEGTRNFSVIGVDILGERIEMLLQGKSPIEGIDDKDIEDVVNNSHKLKPLHVYDSDPKAPDPRPAPETIRPLVGADVFVICVPTPLDSEEQWKPDMRWIKKAAKLLGHVCELEAAEGALPTERLIVLESTSYPGTTREYFGEFIDTYKTDGRQWFLAYSPERTNPGKKNTHETDPKEPKDMFDIKRVVGGLDTPDREHAEAFYKNIFKEVEPVASLEAAEMVKLVENTFRFTVIGFANEMSRVARSFGLNIWDIMHAVKTKEFGLGICDPGLVGGHCIPIDPQYLNWAFRNQRQIAAFIDVAEKAHQEMKRDALELIQRLLNQNNRGIAGSSILFLGVAYKKNVADTRESAALDLMKKLYSSGADVYFWDPVRAKHTEKRPVHLEFSNEEFKQLPPKKQEGLEPNHRHYYLEPSVQPGNSWDEAREEILSTKYDCIVISTDHDDFQPIYEELITAEVPRPLADLRNAIESWLSQWVKEERLTEEKAAELRQKLSSQRSKYMLLGVH